MRYTLALIVTAALCSTVVVAQVEIPEGFEIVEITRSQHWGGTPAINNCGQIVFDQQLGPNSSSKEIFLYDNGHIRRITKNDVPDRLGAINDAGVITWNRTMRPPDDDRKIYYENGVETILDNHRYGLSGSAINNLGHVAWSRFRRSECPLAQDLVVWDGEEIRRITPNAAFGRNQRGLDLL